MEYRDRKQHINHDHWRQNLAPDGSQHQSMLPLAVQQSLVSVGMRVRKCKLFSFEYLLEGSLGCLFINGFYSAVSMGYQVGHNRLKPLQYDPLGISSQTIKSKSFNGIDCSTQSNDNKILLQRSMDDWQLVRRVRKRNLQDFDSDCETDDDEMTGIAESVRCATAAAVEAAAANTNCDVQTGKERSEKINSIFSNQEDQLQNIPHGLLKSEKVCTTSLQDKSFMGPADLKIDLELTVDF